MAVEAVKKQNRSKRILRFEETWLKDVGCEAVVGNGW